MAAEGAASFRAPGFPLPHLFTILVTLALLTGVVIEDPRSGVYVLVIVLLTLPLFEFFRRMARPADDVPP